MILRRMVFAFLLLLCHECGSLCLWGGAVSRFHPYISLKEEYNDNLNLTPTNKSDDYITTVQPGIRFSNMGKQAGVDLDYCPRGGFLREKQQFELHQP